MDYTKKKVTNDEESTIWKNKKYSIPITFEDKSSPVIPRTPSLLRRSCFAEGVLTNTPTESSSSIRTNDFNYANIQLPTLDGFVTTPEKRRRSFVGVRGITGDGLPSKVITENKRVIFRCYFVVFTE